MVALSLRSQSPLIRARKQWLKSRLGAAYKFWTDRFCSYGASDLRRLLSEMGISAGDCVLMHSSFRPTNGFQGKPQDIISVVLELIGPGGTLVMMSMAYESSTKQYLSTHPIFDVRRTPSRMGILTELFRRRQGVVRSLSPTHPVLALGKRAEWLIEGHDRCLYPCGPGSPFQKMLELDAKMLFFDLPFVGFTFVHYIEHQIQEYLPFPLYEPAPMTALLRDYNGQDRALSVYVFAEQAVRRRNVEIITSRMRCEGTADWRRIGNTQLVVAKMSDALTTGVRLAASGIVPFDSDA
jgi:aminoglycoside 3-N-acetyltransferase